MKILVVGGGGSKQVERLVEEARKHGYKVDNCSSFHLVINASNDGFSAEVEGLDLTSYDLIYLLAVGKRKWEWYVSGRFLKNEHGVTVIEGKMVDDNLKVYFTPTIELQKQVKEGIKFPKTTVISSEKTLEEALLDHTFPVIIKNSYAQGGKGVYLVKDKKEALDVIKKDGQAKAFYIREYIPNEGDVRVFTIGGKAVAGMRRIPPKDDFRSNISLGGTAEAFDLEKNPEIRLLAEKLSKMDKTQIAGVDIMIHKETNEPYVLEINRGPQFRGLEKYTGINIASKIIEYFETLV